MLTKLRIRVADESGVTIVFAIQILAILTMMVSAVMASSVSLGNSTERDYSSKNALGAALSGLDVARYRLEEVNPADNMCLTSAAVATGSGGAATGECPAYTGDLGNGTTYGYYVTPAVVGGTCAGQTITSSTATRRCITAYGTANGVTRRAQSLVARDPVTSGLFPFSGMLGLDSVSVNESGHGTINGPVGSNGAFSLSNCQGDSNGVTWKPGPTATMAESCSGTPTSETATSTPWTLTPLDSFYSGTQIVNDNATVFGAASGFNYDPVTREVRDTNDATLILNGPNPRTGSGGLWIFNFCKLNFSHVTQIRLLNSATARFLIDSNQRTGSGCASSASMNMTAVSAMNVNPSTGLPGDPTQLQFFYYGTGTAEVNNKSGFSATFYGPNAQLKATNDTTWIGAIAAKSISATNGLNFTAGDVSSLTGGGGGYEPWQRTTPGFVECRSAVTTATDPESGC
jgi:hypothetical protein